MSGTLSDAFKKNVSFGLNLISCDSVSLYSSILIELGMESLEYWVDTFRAKIPMRFIETLTLELSIFVLAKYF